MFTLLKWNLSSYICWKGGVQMRPKAVWGERMLQRWPLSGLSSQRSSRWAIVHWCCRRSSCATLKIEFQMLKATDSSFFQWAMVSSQAWRGAGDAGVARNASWPALDHVAVWKKLKTMLSAAFWTLIQTVRQSEAQQITGGGSWRPLRNFSVILVVSMRLWMIVRAMIVRAETVTQSSSEMWNGFSTCTLV